MLYVISDASYPVIFSSAGNLTNENGFLHPKRILDSYELISVTEGSLSIHAGEREHQLHPGEFLLLFPGECHYGAMPSTGKLSFYWTHFYFQAEDTSLFNETKEHPLLPLYQKLEANPDHPFYILPEKGKLSENCRTNVLFVQLLDLAKRFGALSLKQCSYAQSTLLLELTHECFFRHSLMQQHQKLPSQIAEIMEWLQLNYDTTLSVAELAEKFGYHPSYLTALFKSSTGQTITEYRNRQRIRVSENLLTATPKLSLSAISEQVGISDEKYFMRLFRRFKGITPSAYREAFNEKKKNRI